MIRLGLILLIAGVAALTLRGWSGQPEPRDPIEWGLYQILWSKHYDAKVTETLTAFASKPAYVMFYRDLTCPFPTTAVDAIARHGATAIVSLELWRWHGGPDSADLAAIRRGDYDAFLRAWARDAKKDGRRVLLRFGFEFNGDWFPWSQDPEAFVASWRRAHDLFREVGVTNVEWVWAPNIVSCPDKPENNMHRYYPGDRYVDWVALDGYNFGEHHDKWHQWQSFSEVFASALDDFSRRYAGKPIMLSEFGSAPGKPGQRADWIRQAYRALGRYPQVKAVIWFHYDKRRENEPNFSLAGDPAALKAFNETFAAPHRKTARNPRP